eukprot:scpid77349/ scgid0915/ 
MAAMLDVVAPRRRHRPVVAARPASAALTIVACVLLTVVHCAQGFTNSTPLYFTEERLPNAIPPAGSVTFLGPKITTIPPAIFQVNGETLSNLALEHTHVTTMARDTYQYLPSLHNLSLTGNKEMTYEDGMFMNATELKSLMLAHTDVTKLPAGLLLGLTQLVNLDLSHNSLLTLPADFFTYTPRVKHLDLRNNKINDLPIGLLEPLDISYLSLNISYNSLPYNGKLCVLLGVSKVFAESIVKSYIRDALAGVDCFSKCTAVSLTTLGCPTLSSSHDLPSCTGTIGNYTCPRMTVPMTTVPTTTTPVATVSPVIATAPTVPATAVPTSATMPTATPTPVQIASVTDDNVSSIADGAPTTGDSSVTKVRSVAQRTSQHRPTELSKDTVAATKVTTDGISRTATSSSTSS